MADFKKFGGRGDRSGRGKGGFGGEKREGGFSKDRGFGPSRDGGYVSRPRFDKPFKREDREDRGNREMFDATCSNCGNSCKVPFRPSGDKPVLCDSCFSKKRADSTRDYKSSPEYSDREERRETREERPVRNFAETNTPRPDQKINDLQMKVLALTARIEVLENVKVEVPVKKEKVEKVVKTKPAPKKVAVKKVSKKK